MTCYLAKAHNSWSSVIYTTLIFVVYLLLWKYSYQYHEKCYWSCMCVRFAFSPIIITFLIDREFSTARGCGLHQAKLSICSAEQLFSSPFLVIGWFRLYWGVNLKSRQNYSHQINAYAIWPEKAEKQDVFCSLAYRVFRSEVNFIRFTVTKKPECR